MRLPHRIFLTSYQNCNTIETTKYGFVRVLQKTRFQEGGKGMTSALKLVGKRVLPVLALLCVLFSFALAEDAPIEATMTLTPSSLAAPASVEYSIRVVNVSGEDMVNAVTLYDPAGKVVAGFGDGGSTILKSEDYCTVTGQISVTQEQLDAGEVCFTLRYKDAAGADQQLTISALITYTGERAELTVTRTLSPEVVRENATAFVIYELYNAGTVDLTNIKIVENIASKSPQTVSSLKVGEKKTLTFTAKMKTKDLTSSAKITYKAAGASKSTTMQLDELTIPVAVKGLKVSLSASSTSVNIGDTIVLTLTAENNGNISYTDVTVTDEKLGTVFEGLSIPAGAVVTKEKEVTVLEPTRYTFTLKLNDNTGMTNTITTDGVPVSAYDPEKELKLTLLLTADKETVESMPADVRMTLQVSNVSSVDCTNIKITHGETSICTISSLKAGESTTIKRDFSISQSGKFRFTATAKDTIGNSVSFDSNTLSIAYAAPTATPTQIPEVTVAPLVTVAPATYNDVDDSLRGTRNILYTAAFVLGGAFVVCFLLYIVSAIIRAGKRHQSNQAYDHLELGDRRDYTEPAEEKTASDTANESSEQDTESVVMPHEKLLRERAEQEDEPMFDIPDPVPPEQLIRPEAANIPAAEAETDRPTDAPDADDQGGYRMSRVSADAQPADEQPTEAAEPEKPRRRRAVKKKVEQQDEE